jgi:hypothetical protein
MSMVIPAKNETISSQPGGILKGRINRKRMYIKG